MMCVKQAERVVIPRVVVARTFFQRAVGFMGRRRAPAGMALFFPRCRAVHTCFMGFDLDVYFLDRTGIIVRRVMDLKPWRFAAGGAKTVATLEIPAGSLDGDAIDPEHPLILELEPDRSSRE